MQVRSIQSRDRTFEGTTKRALVGSARSLAATPARPDCSSLRGASFKSVLGALVVLLALPLSTGCEPEVGRRCGSPEQVNQLVAQRPGSNDIIRDVSLDACAQPFCASTNGSRPYCTKTCTTDLDCSQAPGFSCGVVTPFGRLGCLDYDDLGGSCTKEDGSPSDNPVKYCVAPPEVLENRDDEFGREAWPSAEDDPDPEPVDGGQ